MNHEIQRANTTDRHPCKLCRITVPEIKRLIDGGLFERLPATFSVYSLDRIKDWKRLFPAKQDYFERLFGLLDRSSKEAVDKLFAPLREVEQKMDISGGIWNTRNFTLEQVDFLQCNRHLSRMARSHR